MAEAYENLAGRVEEIVYRNPDNGYTVLQLNTGEANGDGETVAGEIDSEVKRIVDECYAKARQMIREHEDVLHRCAELLLEKEKINRDEFEALFEEKTVEASAE